MCDLLGEMVFSMSVDERICILCQPVNIYMPFEWEQLFFSATKS